MKMSLILNAWLLGKEAGVSAEVMRKEILINAVRAHYMSVFKNE